MPVKVYQRKRSVLLCIIPTVGCILFAIVHLGPSAAPGRLEYRLGWQLEQCSRWRSAGSASPARLPQPQRLFPTRRSCLRPSTRLGLGARIPVVHHAILRNRRGARRDPRRAALTPRRQRRWTVAGERVGARSRAPGRPRVRQQGRQRLAQEAAQPSRLGRDHRGARQGHCSHRGRDRRVTAAR